MTPLREKFNQGHYALFKFYVECRNLKYLTSLITVPMLPAEPPNFLSGAPKDNKSAPKSPEPPKEVPAIDWDTEEEQVNSHDFYYYFFSFFFFLIRNTN